MTVTASSMAVDYTRLLREFCRAFGYDSSDMTTEQTTDFQDMLRSAINQVLHPPLVPTLGPQAHQWSWARPVWTMTTSSGQRRYTLPIDFERFVGDLNFQPSEGEYHPLPYMPSARLMNLENVHDGSGTPVMYSLEPVATEGTTEQVWQLVFHPTPDASYRIKGQYQIGAKMLSATYPYPPGGPQMGELYIASLLAIGEWRIDGEAGIHAQAFQQRLMADISIDMLRQPSNLGYCGDGRSGNFGGIRSKARRFWRGLTTGYTTYEGGTEF